MAFTGSSRYIATESLLLAVNAAIQLERPLLLKGEPGTGKTMLAEEVATSFDAPLIEWHIKSTTKAEQGLYEYDAVSRLRDSQLGDEKVHDISNYIKKGKLWQAFESEKRVVLLIDEIDKADLEFPNDLLLELDKMMFHVYETKETIRAKHRPIIIITSNNEKELPAPFLRRCFFHFIAFPDEATLTKIVESHYPELDKKIMQTAIDAFSALRDIDALSKKPSTAELIDWIGLLMMESIDNKTLKHHLSRDATPIHAGALIKNEQDMSVLAKMANLLRY